MSVSLKRPTTMVMKTAPFKTHILSSKFFFAILVILLLPYDPITAYVLV